MNDFVIKTNSDVPIYRQLVEQVRRMAASGRVKPGDRLPSVRQLAENLAINPMTISKAYSLLEQSGLLERRRGVGMVLSHETGRSDNLLQPAIEELIMQARQLGISKRELVKQLGAAWEFENDE